MDFRLWITIVIFVGMLGNACGRSITVAKKIVLLPEEIELLEHLRIELSTSTDYPENIHKRSIVGDDTDEVASIDYHNGKIPKLNARNEE